MSKNTFKYVIMAGLFAVPFVPFVVSSSLFFPFITGKAFVFRLLVEVVTACYLILALRDASVRPKFSWVLGALTAFLVVMGLATIFAVNPFKAFWSNYERMEGYITLLHLFAYFIVLGSVLKTREVWDRLLATTLGASAVMAVYSFLQIGGKIAINQGGVRVDGTLGNAAYLGIYMVFHIFIAAILFTRFKETWQRVVIGLIALADLVVLYFTATRGAILGLLGGALVAFIFLLIKSEKGAAIRKVALGGLLGLVVLVGAFLAVRDASFVKNNAVLGRFASMSFDEIKTQGRYYVWPMALKGFAERPILGWGQEGFNFVFNEHYDPRMYNQEPWFDRAHSTPLDWLIAGGALGLLAYLSIFLAVLVYIFRSKGEGLSKNEQGLLLGLVSAYFFNNLFVFDQIASYILFFTILAYVHYQAPRTHSAWRETLANRIGQSFESDKSRPMSEALILISLTLVVYAAVYAPWQQNKDLLAVLRFNNEGKIGELEDYEKPLLKGGMGFSESLEHISQTAMALAANPSTPAELKDKLFNSVDEAFQKQLERTPTDARYRLFYAMFLSRFGWYGRALEQLGEAQKLSPNKQQIYFEIVNNAIFDGKAEQAVAAAKTAYELEPKYEEAKTLYGLTLIAVGARVEAEEILKDVPESKLVFDDRYITVLLGAKRYADIITVVKKRLELQPDNHQHYLTLAAVYLEAQMRPEAITALEKLIELEPSFKEQGEQYISDIRAGKDL